MRTTTITIDYAHPRGYEIGYQGENNIVNLVLPVPSHIEGADGYRVYFESSAGEYLQTELLTPVDGCVTVTLTSDIIPAPGQIAAQLVAFADGDIIGKAPVIYGTALYAIPSGSTEQVSKSIEAEIALNSAARHGHDNKAVLDKFAESDGKPTYDGKALGGGASDFPIKMTVASDDDGNYTVASCDATVEQIDAAVAAEKRVILLASDDGVVFELPMLQGVQGNSYYFGTFLMGQVIASFVQNVSANESKWQFVMTQVEAESVSYSNAALPNISTVGGALDELVPNSHTHANKDTLDKLSVTNGKLQYNGSDVGLKGDKGDTGATGAPGLKGDTGAPGKDGKDGTNGITPAIGTNGNWYLGTTDTGKPSRGEKGKTPVKGTDYWTEADKAEIVNDTLAALPKWTGGSY